MELFFGSQGKFHDFLNKMGMLQKLKRAILVEVIQKLANLVFKKVLPYESLQIRTFFTKPEAKNSTITYINLPLLIPGSLNDFK